jgi:hypothetical protein
MTKNIHLLFAYCLLPLVVSAQPELYLSRDFQQAVQQGTRTLAGQAGTDYWQNRAHYAMEVEIVPSEQRVRGKARVQYFNHSPQELRRLNLKLIQNIHLPQAVRATRVDESYLTEGIALSNVRVDGQAAAWNNQAVQASSDPTNAWLALPQPLASGQSVQLEWEWSYRLQRSQGHHREGMVDEGSAFCAYWYPRIAVYDDLSGWDVLPHDMQTEFYGDFNDYEVTIRVPEGFVVWATGTLSNAAELLNEPYLQRWQQAAQSDEIVTVVAAEDLARGGLTRPGPLAWRYQAENVTDFAFAWSDRYCWDATSVTVDDASGRRALVQAAYSPQSTDFPQVADIARNCIRYFSTQMPAIPYPYPAMTVFNGHGQMEFPMMVNDIDMHSLDDTRALTAHEIAHTYFPFLTGINETAFAWMDEGWATLLEYFACTELYTLRRPELAIYPGYYLRQYVGQQGPHTEVPIFTPTHQLRNPAYGLNAYGKPASAYLSLMHLLGRDKFLECLHGYVARWQGKHPHPYDFFFAFNDLAGQNLDWFWQAWFMEYNTMNLALEGYRYAEGVSYARVRNAGGKPLPILLKATLEDGSSQEHFFSPAVWVSGEMIELPFATPRPARRLELLWRDFVDVDPRDDVWEE